MDIYTSYFAQHGNIPEGAIEISIALYSPKWWTGRECKSLAPTQDLLVLWNTKHDEFAYEFCFKNYLKQLDFDHYKEMFKILSNNGQYPIFLLCYERPSAFCHRHLVAEWFTSNGLKCEEWIK